MLVQFAQHQIARGKIAAETPPYIAISMSIIVTALLYFAILVGFYGLMYDCNLTMHVEMRSTKIRNRSTYTRGDQKVLQLTVIESIFNEIE